MMKHEVKRLVQRMVNLLVKSSRDFLSQNYVSDDVIVSMLKNDRVEEIHDPLAYINFLRDCIQPLTFSIKELKGKAELDTVESKLFVTLLDALRLGIPPVDFQIAKEIGLIADSYRATFLPLEYSRWAGDTALHFSLSSSLGRKGRLLFNIIRLMRSRECLELGTAYGLSALFIVGGMRATAARGHLTTIELEEHQFSLASAMLKAKCENSVACIQGSTQNQLPLVTRNSAGLDFVFHDAGHTREDYIGDFNAFVGALKAGAVVVIDDIHWDDPRWYATASRAHEGWMEVTSHPRVRRAVEIDEELGLLLID